MASGITQDTVVINDLNGLRLEQRTRTTKSGTSVRYSIGITSELAGSDRLGASPELLTAGLRLYRIDAAALR